MKAIRHVNIPIFIPHLGCRNQCVFCNQRAISGVKSFDLSKVRAQIELRLSTRNPEDVYEIAFFGGSFTGIDRELMISLLALAKEYIDKGEVKFLRCSTRPDYIDGEILDILAAYGVRTIELGLQSTSDKVLLASKRGHSSEQEFKAASLIVERGFTLGGQMMIGLPESTPDDEVKTALDIVRMGASEARIYPTLVFSETELKEMQSSSLYTPLTLDDAVKRSAAALKIFLENGIKVLRVGLCESDGLRNDGTLIAGPYHPAIGELVFSQFYYDKIVTEIKNKNIKSDSDIVIYCSAHETSKIVGHNKANRLRLKSEYGINIVKIIEHFVSGNDIAIVSRERT